LKRLKRSQKTKHTKRRFYLYLLRQITFYKILSIRRTEELSPDQRAKYVKDAVKICAKEKMNGAGIFSNGANSFVIVNSNGLEAYFENSNVTFSITAQAKTLLDGRNRTS